EVTNATVGGSLTRSGAGSNPDPYTLDVIDGGIGTAELATNAVTTIKIADGDVTPAKIEPSVTNGQILTTVTGNVTWANPAVVAMGKVNGAATTVNANGAAVVRTGVGSYTVTLGTAIPTADYIIQLTLQSAGANSYVEVTSQLGGSFTVQISNSGGTALDADWFFTVTDF
ncbi:hypothetical protein WIW50_00525, partial [Flavobacteriaceae bacterium 3-367]